MKQPPLCNGLSAIVLTVRWSIHITMRPPLYNGQLMLRCAIKDNVRQSWWAMLGRECTCKADEGPRCIAPHRGGASCLYCEADIVAEVMSCGQVNKVQINLCPLPDGASAQGRGGATGSNSPPKTPNEMRSTLILPKDGCCREVQLYVAFI